MYIRVLDGLGKLVDLRSMWVLLLLLHFIDSFINSLNSCVVDSLLHYERPGVRAGGPIAHLGYDLFWARFMARRLVYGEHSSL